MNRRQLRWILSGNKFTKLFFRGVFAIDEMNLIKTVSYPSSFVINLDPSYKPGSHWVAVYFDKNGVSEYFDSFRSKDILDLAIEKIRIQCGRHVNSTMAMYNLMHVQEGTKTFTQFARKVEELATHCQFDTVPCTKERAMKDAIIFGTSDDKLRKEALAKDVDLTTLTKTALGYEQSR